MKKLPIAQAVRLKIESMANPVLLIYDLAVIVTNLYARGEYEGRPLRIQKTRPSAQMFSKIISTLDSENVIRGFSSTVYEQLAYYVVEKKTATAEEIACCLDPFCYISHLSAMSLYNFSERIPEVIHITSPARNLWKILSKKKSEHDLDYNARGYDLKPLKKISFSEINGREIIRHSTNRLGRHNKLKNPNVRISSVGRLFLDMLRNPDNCGGIYHILDVYEEYSEKYLHEIIEEIEINGNSIEKVRAGYILEERLGIQHPTIESWASLSQRGGSRKLDPHSNYAPRFSEKWCISINI